MADTKEAPKIVRERARFYDGAGGRHDDADLRVARKLDLFPSLTEMLYTVEDFGLKGYKTQQLILAAATTPRLDDENDDQFVERVVESADEHRDEAAKRGTRWHGYFQEAIEIGSRPVVPSDERPLLDPAFDWIEEHLETSGSAERVVVNDRLGYAGTTDYHGLYWQNPEIERAANWAVVDFKSQWVKTKHLKRGDEADPKFYPRMVWQLAGYGLALPAGMAAPKLHINLVVSSNPEWPGVWEKAWSEDEIAHGQRMVRRIALVYHEWKKFGTNENDVWALLGELHEIADEDQLPDAVHDGVDSLIAVLEQDYEVEE